MIRYDEVRGLTGEKAQRVRALIDRSSEIWDMPEDMGTIDAWEEQIAACEAEGVPHLAASGRFGQYSILSLGGMPQEALEAYARLMQIVGRYGDHIHPDNVRTFLGTISNLVSTVGDDPSLSRPQLERIVDLVEKQTVAHGFDLSNVTLARASLAAEFGEQDRAYALLDRWQGIGSPDWPPFDANTVTREVAILEPFEPELAAETLTRRFTAMGVPPGPIDTDREDLTQLVLLRALLGSLWARAGRKDLAARIGDELVDQFGIEDLVQTAVVEDLLLVLEHRPDDARVAADVGLANSALDTVDCRLIAALARSRTLEDPAGEEAVLLRAVATEAAAAHDARGGTDIHTRELREIWLADLPPADPEPAAADEPVERAERILRAGWIPRRTAPVTIDEVPFAIKDRYLELHGLSMAVLEAGSEEESEALVESIVVRSRELRMPMAEFVAQLMRTMRAYQSDDHVALVLRYAEAQRAQALAPDGVYPPLEKAAAGLFLPVILTALDQPAIPLGRIDAIIAGEVDLRALTGKPTTPIAMARLARAAHLGEISEIEPLLADVRARLAAEAGDVDSFDVQIDLARILAPLDARSVPGLVADVLESSHDPSQQRAAQAWTAWAALRAGRPVDRDAAEVVAQLEQVDRDFEDFGDLPRSVVLELAAQVPGTLGWAVDAALADTTPGDPYHLDTFAGAARVLLDHAPSDARGPQLREDALAIAAALDERNGSEVQSRQLRERFFQEARERS